MNENENLVPKRRFKEFTNTGTWEQRKLGDMVEFFSGLTYSPDNVIKQPGTLVLRSSNVQNGEIVNADNVYVDNEVVNSDNVQVGDIAVVVRNGSRSLIGKHAAIKYPMKDTVIGAFMTGVRSDTPSFTNALLDTQQFETEIAKNLGATINQITTGNFKKMIFNFPEIDERLRIGDFFNQLDNTIALHQRKLEKTKALKSAYLSELFPVEGERKPKRRFAGFIDDWKQGTVGEYGYFYYGKSAPKWSVTKDAIIPCVRYGELYTKFGAKIDKVYSYTNISKENLKFSTGNEVLVPRVGEDPLDFANCSWLSIPNVAIGEMISVYNTEENPLFISYYFNSQLRHAFAKRVEGGNVSNLYFTYLENITISIPNKEEQDTIANFLESLDSVVEHHQHKLEKLKNIKQAYLNELFV